jgi:hypothetical protein
MATPRRIPRARRSGAVPVCAACLAVLGSVALGACLNPMPEEFPSDRDRAPPTTAPNDGLAVGAAGTSSMGNPSGSAGASGGLSEEGEGSPGTSAPPPSPASPDPVETPPDLADAGVDAAPPRDTVTDTTP